MGNKEILPNHKEKIELMDSYDVAAGVTAVMRSLTDGIGQMGLINCTKSFLKLNQTEGYDCPSCAWPDPRPEDRSAIAEYCENGAKAVSEEGTSERADLAFWKKNSVDEMSQWSEYKLGKSGRITHPMILREGNKHYEPIGWDAALELIASQLKDLASPDEAVFYTSGRTSNEAAFLYQLFVRQFGTNNLPDCSNMCHESTSLGLAESIGIGKGTVKLEDFYVADCIVIIGQNPGTNHPRMMSALQKAKRKGCKIISVNPLPETGLMAFKNPQEVRGWTGPATELSDVFLQVRVNGDIALLNALQIALLELEAANPGTIVDHEFIDKYTTGYEAMVANFKGKNINEYARESGVAIEAIRKAAKIISENKRMIICWAMGITQHENGVDNVKAVVNLALMRGSIGIPGAGLCPVRGHSNVQGDRTVGIWDQITDELRQGLKDNFKFEPPEKDGYDVVKAIQAMAEGKVKVFMSMGGNLVLASPDTAMAAEGMRKCDLTVMVSTKPNRNHLITGRTALILPCLGRTEIDMQAGGEQFVSVENSMSIVHKSQGVLAPASPQLMSEPAIVAHLAKATLKNTTVDWLQMAANYDHIRDAIEKCLPEFVNYNERVRREGGFYLPNGASQRIFNTDDGKAHFNVVEPVVYMLAEDELVMTSLRSHDQFNTTIYGNEDRYRGIKSGRRVVMMNKADMSRLGFKAGDYVDLESNYKGTKRRAANFAIIAYDLPEGCIATFYPESNILVPVNKHAKRANTPASKSVIVRLEAAGA